MNPSRNKLLIISSWAPPDIGGPQSLYNLFSQFPPASYAILTSWRSEQHRKTGPWLPCDYYFLDHAPIPLDQQSQQAEQLKQRKIKSSPSLVLQTWELVKNIIRRIGFVKTIILGFILFKKVLSFYMVGRKILRQYPEMNVLGLSDTGAAMIAAYFVSKRGRRDLNYYLYDLYQGNFFEPPNSWAAKVLEKRMFEQAKRVIVTNEGTKEYYLRRYPHLRHRFEVIHNSVFADVYEKQRTPYEPKMPYRIVFTGHVYWPQEQSVLNLIKAMKLLSDLPLELQLYIPNPPATIQTSIRDIPNVLLTSAPSSEMPKIQGQATLLFLPFSWGTKSPDIIATASPGKLSDYLASGRPMLIHAPDYAYVSQYASQYGFALVVDQNDVFMLASAIRSFLSNPTQGQQYIDQALNVFHLNHDAKKNAKKLTELLNMV